MAMIQFNLRVKYLRIIITPSYGRLDEKNHLKYFKNPLYVNKKIKSVNIQYYTFQVNIFNT